MFTIFFYIYRHFKEAREIFNQLMESNPNNLNNLINMAHLEFLQQNYENAIKIYSNYL
jgi:tetratricopeptide (TPR) repeat protein